MNMLERSSYKAGDRFRVVGLPEDLTYWGPPEGKIGTLSNGDIITLSDPPTREHRFPRTITNSTFALRYKVFIGNNVVPPEFCEPVVCDNEGDFVAPCTCDGIVLLLRGCVCRSGSARAN
jgi:hypothetical protein